MDKIIAIVPESNNLDRWLSLINNRLLLDKLKDTNTYAYIYTKENKIDGNIKYINNLEDIENKASLLITDYNNIYIKFAKKIKPIIFYQFEKVDKNIINPKKTIGKILIDEDDVVNRIIGYINMNYRLEKIYKVRISEFLNNAISFNILFKNKKGLNNLKGAKLWKIEN